jgi:3'(2'), 5'-bisphosphate nucleotidase
MVALPAVDYSRELDAAERSARLAGTAILRHYRGAGVRIEIKPDQSPVTEADLDANQIIVDLLRREFPDDGILSEELPDSEERFTKRRVWIIDPLDGTRDFVARTDQFCVHVGLAVDQVAVVGAVYQPVAGRLYSARAGAGAKVREDVREEVRGDVRGEASQDGHVDADADADGKIVRTSTTVLPAEMRAGVSRLNASGRLGACLAATGFDRNAVAMGASVKYMALARGELDLVINLSPGEQEWDTCAPEVVIREAGGLLTDGDGRPFRYNQRDTAHRRGSLASNGACHPALLDLLRPHFAADTV